jgi:two-component system chemotaxis response regulator CheY
MSVREKLRMLVVDDMSTSRGILLQTLDALGIRRVDYAENGALAFAKARETAPHLVLSDLHMPEMNGLELLKTLRSDPKTARIGFILVSGRHDERALRAGRSLGMNNYLPKPFTAEDMRRSIEAVVGRL